jgi:hypothetical protein
LGFILTFRYGLSKLSGDEFLVKQEALLHSWHYQRYQPPQVDSGQDSRWFGSLDQGGLNLASRITKLEKITADLTTKVGDLKEDFIHKKAKEMFGRSFAETH